MIFSDKENYYPPVIYVDLTKNGRTIGQFTLSYQPFIAPDSIGQQLHRVSLSTEALDGSISQRVSGLSQIVDNVSSGAKRVQSAYGEAKDVALYVSPLAEALESLDHIIKIIDYRWGC
jgi:hypothetical protein